MARFRGTVQGARGQASRLGHGSGGLTVEAASWQGKVTVELYADGDEDRARVRLEPHRGEGVAATLYDGPVGGIKNGAGFPVIPETISDVA